jgi:hypothetical protein
MVVAPSWLFTSQLLMTTSIPVVSSQGSNLFAGLTTEISFFMDLDLGSPFWMDGIILLKAAVSIKALGEGSTGITTNNTETCHW